VFGSKDSKLRKLVHSKQRIVDTSCNSLERDMSINEISFEATKQRNDDVRLDLSKSFESSKRLVEDINRTNTPMNERRE